MNLREYVAGGIETWVNPPLLRDLQVRQIKPFGDVTLIQMDARWRGVPEEPRSGWASCQVGIDLATREINWWCTSPQLFNKEHKGSGALAVAVMTLPVAIACSPFIALRRAQFARHERERGMSRFASTVLMHLEGRVSLEIWDALKEAFQKSWQRELFFSRYVSFREAYALLSACRLVEEVVTDDDGAKIRTLHWFDEDGNGVAIAQSVDAVPTDVRVLGSTFFGDRAERLMACFRERTVREQMELDFGRS